MQASVNYFERPVDHLIINLTFMYIYIQTMDIEILLSQMLSSPAMPTSDSFEAIATRGVLSRRHQQTDWGL